MKALIVTMIFLATCHATFAKSEPVEVETAISIQDAEGLTEAGFDLDYLRTLKDFISSSFREMYKNDSRNGNKTTPRIQTAATYLTISSKKLAVIRLESDYVNAVYIFGVNGSELRKLVCVMQAPKPAISVFNGKCGDELKRLYEIRN